MVFGIKNMYANVDMIVTGVKEKEMESGFDSDPSIFRVKLERTLIVGK